MPVTTTQDQHMHFWLRAEGNDLERRTPLLPQQAKELIQLGHRVTVEEYDERCVSDSEYASVGCQMVSAGTWITAPDDAIILGLRGIPTSNEPLRHRHIMFGHCFKNQNGWEDFLSRFVRGNGKLWDLEFLIEESGRRVAAFGRSAGYIAMACGIKQWCHSALTKQTMGAMQYYTSTESCIREVRDEMTLVWEETGKVPKIIICGAHGRSGAGAVDFARQIGIPEENIIQWDSAKTENGGPFDEILECDIFVNCILLSNPIPPFLTLQHLQKPRHLSVMVDVSCDFANPHNPVPVYTKITNFTKPSQRILHSPPFDVISIDNLPSLVPLESSREFSGQLFPHLKQCGNSAVWDRAEKLFVEKTNELHEVQGHN